MIIGVTGTRKALAASQRERLEEFISVCGEEDVLLHGDCTGADATAHDLARQYGLNIEAFPPTIDTYRAFKLADIVHPTQAYRLRNQEIVDRCTVLIALPEGPESQHPRSGTWQTVRMARRAGRAHVIVLPDPVDKPEVRA